jgi:sec-independent protein translocase protein TatA
MHFPSLPGLLLAVIAGVLLFGPRRLPEMGAALGQGIRELKKSLHEIGDVADSESPVSSPRSLDVPRSADPTAPSPAVAKQLAAPTRSDAERVLS